MFDRRSEFQEFVALLAQNFQNVTAQHLNLFILLLIDVIDKVAFWEAFTSAAYSSGLLYDRTLLLEVELRSALDLAVILK